MISIRLYSSLSELLQMLAIPRQQKRHENTRPLTAPLNFAVWVKIGALCAFLIIDLTFSQIKREKKGWTSEKVALTRQPTMKCERNPNFSDYISFNFTLHHRRHLSLFSSADCCTTLPLTFVYLDLDALLFFLSLILLYVHARAVPGGLVRYVCFLCSAWPHFHMIASDTCLQDKFLCSAYRCCADNQRHSENMRQMETICTMNNF